jgi:hypothetical protein
MKWIAFLAGLGLITQQTTEPKALIRCASDFICEPRHQLEQQRALDGLAIHIREHSRIRELVNCYGNACSSVRAASIDGSFDANLHLAAVESLRSFLANHNGNSSHATHTTSTSNRRIPVWCESFAVQGVVARYWRKHPQKC